MNPNRREFLAVAGASVFAGYAGFTVLRRRDIR